GAVHRPAVGSDGPSRSEGGGGGRFGGGVGKGATVPEPDRLAGGQVGGRGSDLVRPRPPQEMRVRQLRLALPGHDAQRHASLVRHARVRQSRKGAPLLSSSAMGDEAAPFLVDYFCISTRRKILPVADFGIWSMNCTSRMRLCGATRSATQPISASAVAVAEGLSTTNAFGTSPASSSTLRTTAASSTAGCVSSSASRSAGATCMPLYLISSFVRSEM